MDEQVSLSTVLSNEEIKALLSPAQERGAWHASFMKMDVPSAPVTCGTSQIFAHVAQALTAVFKDKTGSPFVSFATPCVQEMLLNEYQKQLMSDMCILPFVSDKDTGLLVLDADLAYALLDMMLGGRRGLGTLHKDSYTHIESTVLQEQMKAMLSAISATLKMPLQAASALLAPAEVLTHCAPEKKLIGEYSVRLDQTEGRLILVLPMSAQVVGEQFERDNAPATPMSEAMAHHLQRVNVEMSAVLRKQNVPFKNLFNLKKGQFLALNKNKTVVVQCEQVPLFEGKLTSQKDAVVIDKGVAGCK